MQFLKLISHVKTDKINKRVVFLDLIKAFDTVDQRILLKLENAEIRGVAHKLCKSYLQYKTCCKKVGKIKLVNCGVPQVLYFLLFIHINSFDPFFRRYYFSFRSR